MALFVWRPKRGGLRWWAVDFSSHNPAGLEGRAHATVGLRAAFLISMLHTTWIVWFFAAWHAENTNARLIFRSSGSVVRDVGLVLPWLFVLTIISLLPWAIITGFGIAPVFAIEFTEATGNTTGGIIGWFADREYRRLVREEEARMRRVEAEARVDAHRRAIDQEIPEVQL